MIRYAVVGAPRSCTMWTAQALSACGWLTPHEPEPVWDDYGNDSALWRSADWPGISSCWLTPFAGGMRHEGVRIIHLVRHPVDVVRSMLWLNMLENRDGDDPYPFQDFICSRVGDVWARRTPDNRALEFWLRWTRLAAVNADETWCAPVSRRTVRALGDVVGLEQPNASVLDAALAIPPVNYSGVAGGDPVFDGHLYGEAMDWWSYLAARAIT